MKLSGVKIFAGCFALVLFCSSAHANAVKKMSLTAQAELSDLVVVGKVVSIQEGVYGKSETASGYNESYARIVVTATLKGQPPSTLDVLIRGPISEFNPDCCKIGDSYVFFLDRLGETDYQAINAPYGIYHIDRL